MSEKFPSISTRIRTVWGRNSKDPSEQSRYAEQEEIPVEAGWFL